MSYPIMFSVPVRDVRVGDVVFGFRIVGIHQETSGNVHVLTVYNNVVDSTDTGYYYCILGTNGELYRDGNNVKVWPNFYTDNPGVALRHYFTMIGMPYEVASYI
jgi:hypothetical protein